MNDACPIGPNGHKWVLGVDGGAYLRLAEGEVCPPCYPDHPEIRESVCERAVFDYAGWEDVQMEPLAVTVTWMAEHDNLGGWHHDVPCDHNWWWQVEPATQAQP